MRPVRWAQHVAASELSWRARCVAAILATHCTGSDMPTSTCSVASITRWSGLSESTVKRAVAELQGALLLVALHQHRKACRNLRKCDGCAPTKWLLVPPDKAEDNPEGGSHRTRDGFPQNPPRGASQNPHKEKYEIEGAIPSPRSNVIALNLDHIGRLP